MRDIQSTIGAFATSFDLKDWAGLEAVLADEIEVDYSDLRGEKGKVARSAYIAKRRTALEPLETHHLLGNLELEASADAASCRASGVIYRRKADEFFHSHVVYRFGLRRDERGWRIASITQRVLWSEGNPALHSGAR
ncbi:MAG TPA: nuclear transport factor 2 family protein [Anaeromyxobacter sp.]